MYSILASNVQNHVGFWGSAPDPAGGAYDAPPDPLVARGFLPSAIAASHLRHLQYPHLHCLQLFYPPWTQTNSVKGRWLMRVGGDAPELLGDRRPCYPFSSYLRLSKSEH